MNPHNPSRRLFLAGLVGLVAASSTIVAAAAIPNDAALFAAIDAYRAAWKVDREVFGVGTDAESDAAYDRKEAARDVMLAMRPQTAEGFVAKVDALLMDPDDTIYHDALAAMRTDIAALQITSPIA